MIINTLGIFENFSVPYGICDKLQQAIYDQPDLPQHYIAYFCPACFFANYVNTQLPCDVIECCQCGYLGDTPNGHRYDKMGTDEPVCMRTGSACLPKQCSCYDCSKDSQKEMPGSICPCCGSVDLHLHEGDFVCNSCGNTGCVQVSLTVSKLPETFREIDLEDLSNTKEIQARRFELVDQASKAAIKDIQQDIDKDIIAALKEAAARREKKDEEIKNKIGSIIDEIKDMQKQLAAAVDENRKATPEDIADIQAQIAAVANDPNGLTIITHSYGNTECNDAGDYFN